MKKTAMKISGNITLILFFLLFLVAVLYTLVQFEVDFALNLLQKNQVLSSVISLVAFIFVGMPQQLLNAAGLKLEGNTILLALSIILCVFTLLMILWGVKEIKLSKLDDEKFARCKKTCAFMMTTKFAFLAYLMAAVICSVIIDEFSIIASQFQNTLNVPYIFLIVSGALTVIAFLIFVLPVSNILIVASAVKEDNANFAQANNYVAGTENEIKIDDSEEMQNFYSQAPAPTMQANMPPIAGYRPQVVSQTSPVNMSQPQPTVQPQVESNPQVANAQSQVNIAPQPQVSPQPNVMPQNTVQQGVQPQVAPQPALQPQTNVTTQPMPQPTPQPAVQPQVAPQQVSQTQAVASTQVATQPQVNQGGGVLQSTPATPVQPQAPTVQPQTTPVQPTVSTTPISSAQTSNVSDEQLVANLTEQGMAELQRIDRLKSIGAITEQNYATMRQKILSSNQK